MKLGAIFPQSDIELDAVAVRDWAVAVEEMGFDHVVFYDHVLGASRDHHAGWDGFHDSGDRFHEVFVLLGYLAAVTTRIEFAPGILGLAQRQTALVAKQAAEIDILSGGRLRLGVGVGWNHVEFEALGSDFTNRGRRIEEQIGLLRRLWTEPIVDFHGTYHDVTHAGLNPLPVQRPIPIWYGSRADSTLSRVARLADGWMPDSREPDIVAPQLEKLHALLQAEGRDVSSFGFEARIGLRQGGPDLWRDYHARWEELGATHLSIGTIWTGPTTLEGHLDMLRTYAAEVGVL